MIEVIVLPGDVVLGDRACPHCRKLFLPDEKVYLSYGRCTAIHTRCILELAMPAQERERTQLARREAWKVRRRQIMVSGVLATDV